MFDDFVVFVLMVMVVVVVVFWFLFFKVPGTTEFYTFLLVGRVGGVKRQVRDGKEVARLVGVSHKRPGRPIAAAIREHLLSENWPERRHTGVNGRGEWT